MDNTRNRCLRNGVKIFNDYFGFINSQYSSARIYPMQFLALQVHGKSP